jgi:glutamine amidotransferase PdxT
MKSRPSNVTCASVGIAAQYLADNTYSAALLELLEFMGVTVQRNCFKS